jgi:hypothetical protein
MRFLRSLLGVTSQDRIPNKKIRNLMQVDNMVEIKKQDINRMQDSMLPKLMYLYKPKGQGNMADSDADGKISFKASEHWNGPIPFNPCTRRREE